MAVVVEAGAMTSVRWQTGRMMNEQRKMGMEQTYADMFDDITLPLFTSAKRV